LLLIALKIAIDQLLGKNAGFALLFSHLLILAFEEMSLLIAKFDSNFFPRNILTDNAHVKEMQTSDRKSPSVPNDLP
jgi:hypothetical protein